MNTLKSLRLRPMTALALVVGFVGVTGCTSIGYRCPLDPTEKPESPTACAGMNQALSGAKLGTGGKTSVLLDDRGRIIPPEMMENRPAMPLKAAQAYQGDEPYSPQSGSPNFKQPKVFQVWASSFTDANGTLHDGHTAWFSTPGRWTHGSVDQPTVVGDSLLRPTTPMDRPPGRIVQPTKQGTTAVAKQDAAQPQTQQERDKAALQALSSAANSAASNAQPAGKPAPQAAPQANPAAVQAPANTGVTAPAISLSN